MLRRASGNGIFQMDGSGSKLVSEIYLSWIELQCDPWTENAWESSKQGCGKLASFSSPLKIFDAGDIKRQLKICSGKKVKQKAEKLSTSIAVRREWECFWEQSCGKVSSFSSPSFPSLPFSSQSSMVARQGLPQHQVQCDSFSVKISARRVCQK